MVSGFFIVLALNLTNLTVTTGLRGADLNNTYGADYNFMPADLYIQLRNNGVTLFIFVAPRT